VVKKEQSGDAPETVTLRVPLPSRVMQDLVALAELYHATPERMVASWTQTHVDNLVAGLSPSGAQPPEETPEQPAAENRLAQARDPDLMAP
jgi:hypothetical protein